MQAPTQDTFQLEETYIRIPKTTNLQYFFLFAEPQALSLKKTIHQQYIQFDFIQHKQIFNTQQATILQTTNQKKVLRRIDKTIYSNIQSIKKEDSTKIQKQVDTLRVSQELLSPQQQRSKQNIQTDIYFSKYEIESLNCHPNMISPQPQDIQWALNYLKSNNIQLKSICIQGRSILLKTLQSGDSKKSSLSEYKSSLLRPSLCFEQIFDSSPFVLTQERTSNKLSYFIVSSKKPQFRNYRKLITLPQNCRIKSIDVHGGYFVIIASENVIVIRAQFPFNDFVLLEEKGTRKLLTCCPDKLALVKYKFVKIFSTPAFQESKIKKFLFQHSEKSSKLPFLTLESVIKFKGLEPYCYCKYSQNHALFGGINHYRSLMKSDGRCQQRSLYFFYYFNQSNLKGSKGILPDRSIYVCKTQKNKPIEFIQQIPNKSAVVCYCDYVFYVVNVSLEQKVKASSFIHDRQKVQQPNRILAELRLQSLCKNLIYTPFCFNLVNLVCLLQSKPNQLVETQQKKTFQGKLLRVGVDVYGDQFGFQMRKHNFNNLSLLGVTHKGQILISDGNYIRLCSILTEKLGEIVAYSDANIINLAIDKQNNGVIYGVSLQGAIDFNFASFD